MKNDFTAAAYQLKRRAKRDGTIPVYIRVFKEGKYIYFTTGISIDEKYWNPKKGEVRKNHNSYNAFNAEIQSQIAKIEETAAKLKPGSTLNDLKDALSGNVKEYTFIEYATAFNENLKKAGRFWVYKQTRNALNRWIECFGKRLILSQVQYKLIDTYQKYLIKKGYHNNTIRKHLQNIKRIINEAHKTELIENDPFKYFKPVKEKKSSKTRLSVDQIKAIEALELEPGKWADITRDAFMFSFYNAGIRFGDIARLQWKHIIDGRLKYNMAKTGTGKNIKLLLPALKILEKYRPEQPKADDFIFPILDANRDYSDESFLKAQISSKNVSVNRHLKQLAKLAGIEESVSFHVSRHSFADYARTAGISIYDISKALGHSDITITQSYMKSFDETSLDASMEKLFLGE